MSTVIFSHGKESGPNGAKINLLSRVAQELGFLTASIDYTKCKGENERVNLLTQSIQSIPADQLFLVGSSMGGYVSTVISLQIEVSGLFLMCPAFYMPGYEVQNYSPKCQNIEIIHGWHDDIVPFEHSIKFAKLNSALLHLTADNHRLTNSHELLEHFFLSFLRKLVVK